jgi:hypothetical protein
MNNEQQLEQLQQALAGLERVRRNTANNDQQFQQALTSLTRALEDTRSELRAAMYPSSAFCYDQTMSVPTIFDEFMQPGVVEADRGLAPERHKKIVHAQVRVKHLEITVGLLDPATTPDARIALGQEAVKLEKFESMMKILA